MNHLEIVLFSLTTGLLTILCGFVVARRAQRVLPFFAAYSALLLANTMGLFVVYKVFGFRSAVAYDCYWTSILMSAALRSLAIAELCRFKLRAYPGIWGLGWRVLVGFSILFLLHSAFDTWGQPNRFAIYSLTLDRDLDIASVAILAALLLIHNYYGLSLEPLQRTIATGICLICAVDIVGDTIVLNLFTGYLLPFFAPNNDPLRTAVIPFYDRLNDIWSTVHLFSFMAAMGIWCYALRKPIPAQAERPVLLPVEVYREMSPAINLRLSAVNDRLLEWLKP